MVYIFSNVMRHEKPAEFVELLKKQDFADPTFVFLNECIPLDYGFEYFKNYRNMMTFHNNCRISHSSDVIYSAGLNKILSKYHQYLKYIFTTTNLISGNIISDFKSLQFIRNTPEDIAYRRKENNKQYNPTVGYNSYTFFKNFLNVDEHNICMVNFYGNDDNSTPHATCHNWKYEEEFFRTKNKLFI